MSIHFSFQNAAAIPLVLGSDHSLMSEMMRLMCSLGRTESAVRNFNMSPPNALCACKLCVGVGRVMVLISDPKHAEKVV